MAFRADHRIAVTPSLLLYAVRYALGRETYAVGDVARAVFVHVDGIPPNVAEAIRKDITAALNAGQAGAPADREQWRMALDALGGPL
jgi:hypothetical protein